MEYINKNGYIEQPESYATNPQYIVEEIFEDQKYIHIKGDVGYLNDNIQKTDNTNFSLSVYDGIDFHIKYNKETEMIEISENFRTTTCDKEEYCKFSDYFFYDKLIKNFNDGIHFPYYRLPRSKDCILIPHFIKSLWKYDMPKILLFNKDK